jgi:mannose-6-phosphate isomerase
MTSIVSEPIVFEPYFRPQVWGGRQLLERLGKPLPPEGRFGESWEISAHPHHVSRVSEGTLRGTLLSDLWRDYGAQLLGRAVASGEKFPLLLKYLDCRELLSVQVHPDDAAARRLTSDELGKTEAWVILHAEPCSRIFAGLKPGVTREELARNLDQGTVADCLYSFTPKAGECLLLRAGTIHAVGGGVLIAEVQQSSDATFRLFDWNRLGADGKPRALHRAQALEAIDWTLGPARPLAPRPLAGLGPQGSVELLAQCPYFELRRHRLEGPTSHTIRDPASAGRMTLWTLLEGAAELHTTAGYSRRFAAGQSVLLPAACAPAKWQRCGQEATVAMEVLV